MTTHIEHSRQDYLDHKCNFREYYGQFVTDYIKKAVVARIGIERLKKAFGEDEHLNTISLATWDMFHSVVSTTTTAEKMKAAGDYLTQAGIVCIAKEAARQAVEESNKQGD